MFKHKQLTLNTLNNMRSKLAMLGLITGAMMSVGGNQGRPFEIDEDDSTPTKKPIPNGCKEYSFHGYTVVALNEKTARKKCEKLYNKAHGL